MKDKTELREQMWGRLEQAGGVRFPGARGRIPNFAGVEEAARRLSRGAYNFITQDGGLQAATLRFKMDESLQRVSQFLSNYTTRLLAKHFERIQKMPGANQLFKRIACASSKEQLEDCLAEVQYALVFAGLGFHVEIEPLGRKGPDLGVSRDNRQAIVEVTRFRRMYPGPPVLDLSGPMETLPEYGNPPRDIGKAFEKILKKFRQVEDIESIIAIWNDDEDMEELEVGIAVAQLQSDGARQIIPLPNGLQFVLYGSNAIFPDGRQLFCFPLRSQYQPHQVTWQQELASSTVNELIQRALSQATNSGL